MIGFEIWDEYRGYFEGMRFKGEWSGEYLSIEDVKRMLILMERNGKEWKRNGKGMDKMDKND